MIFANPCRMRYAIWRFHTVGSFWATLAVPNLRLPFFVCLFKHFLGSPKGAYRDTSRKVKLCESPGKAGGFPFINNLDFLSSQLPEFLSEAIEKQSSYFVTIP